MRNKALGQVIQSWMMDHGETQGGLARRLGITRQRVWQWEVRGVPDYDVRLVQLALQALDFGSPGKREEAGRDLALGMARLLLADENRVSLDDVLTRFGYTRNQLKEG